jgi:hypothetical protein
VCKRNGEPKFYARKSTDEEDGTCFRQVKVKVMVRVNEGFRFVWWCVVCQNKPHTHTQTPPPVVHFTQQQQQLPIGPEIK